MVSERFSISVINRILLALHPQVARLGNKLKILPAYSFIAHRKKRLSSKLEIIDLNRCPALVSNHQCALSQDMRNGVLLLTRRIAATQCRKPSKSILRPLRWSSTADTTWSTPLAQTIAEAIEVCLPKCPSVYYDQLMELF